MIVRFSISRPVFALLLSLAGIAIVGCSMHGRPGAGPEVVRPEEVLDFPTLYNQNCAACHGNNGKNGAAISLANPVYIELTGQANLQNIIAHGVSGGLMPPFAKSSGGMLTDKQILALAQGMVQQWGNASSAAGQTLPPYLATLTGNAEHGQQAYGIFCARCHGVNGGGAAANATGEVGKLGSIVDPSYLALISNQDLRSILIAGRPDLGMPDWRNDAAQPMNDQQITDILAWLASKRVSNPGQPYPTQP